MRFGNILIFFAAAATAYADCSSLGAGATNAVSGRFNLAAYDATSGITSALHVLNAVTIPYTSYHILGTASSPSFGWLGLTMSGGVITTVPPSQYTAPAYTVGNLSPNSDYPPNPPGPFVTFANTGTPSSAFCVVPDASTEKDIVAFNGFTNLFSLCTSYVSELLPITTAVLFNASASAYGDGYDTYNGASCVPVKIVIVPE